MHRLQVQLSENQFQALREQAQSHHVSISHLIREAVDDALAASGLLQDKSARWQNSLSIVGKFRSGKSDVSSLHDRYLDEAYDS